jgi:opacity protein-like surface antigen
MKKLIVLIGCVLTLASSVFAADTNSTSLFNVGELGLSLGSGYTVDRAAAFQQPYAINLQAGAFWFPWRNLGFEADVPFYSTKGVSVQEVQAGLVARLPLSKTVPVLKNIAPYVGVGGVYNWQTDEKWAYVAKGGVEFRFNKKWGVFGEAQYRNTDFEWSDGQTSVVGGLKFVF